MPTMTVEIQELPGRFAEVSAEADTGVEVIVTEEPIKGTDQRGQTPFAYRFSVRSFLLPRTKKKRNVPTASAVNGPQLRRSIGPLTPFRDQDIPESSWTMAKRSSLIQRSLPSSSPRPQARTASS